MEKLISEQQLQENKDTLPDCEYRILQSPCAFKYGIDAVLLARFTDVRKSKLACDLCSGTAAVALMVAAKNPELKIKCVEIQKDAWLLANKNIVLNNLENRLEALCADVKDLSAVLPKNSFDAVMVNPPYAKAGSAVVNHMDALGIARHELLCSLEDVIKTAGSLLRSNGKLFMIHRPARLVEIFDLMVKNKIEPKRMQLVYPDNDEKPTMVLVEGEKCARQGLLVMEPLFVR